MLPQSIIDKMIANGKAATTRDSDELNLRFAPKEPLTEELLLSQVNISDLPESIPTESNGDSVSDLEYPETSAERTAYASAIAFASCVDTVTKRIPVIYSALNERHNILVRKTIDGFMNIIDGTVPAGFPGTSDEFFEYISKFYASRLTAIKAEVGEDSIPVECNFVIKDTAYGTELTTEFATRVDEFIKYPGDELESMRVILSKMNEAGKTRTKTSDIRKWIM